MILSRCAIFRPATAEFRFIEKPLADNSRAAQELCRKAEQMSKTLMTGHIVLFNEALQHVSELVQKGDLGNLFYIHTLRTNLGPICSDVNELWDLASHDISIFVTTQQILLQ